MNKKQIAAAIVAATGKSVADVAKDQGYSKHAFYDVIRGRTKSPHLRALIAGIIGKDEDEIWPEKSKNTAIFECSNRIPQKENY
jgi:lambda repressor-like predicted transcriptional regulator